MLNITFIKYVLTFLVCLTFINLLGQSHLIRFKGRAQGTFYAVSYYDSLNRNFKIEIDSVLNDFDSSLSTYKSFSIISKINTNKSVKTDSLFRVCFHKAKEIYTLTNGLFDPTVKPIMNLWNFENNQPNACIDSAKIDSVKRFVGLDLIDLRSDTIYKCDNRVSLDFNAFAQGYSVDIIAQFLEQKGIFSYLIDVGGEIKAGTSKLNGKLWKVGIEKPTENKAGVNELYAIAHLENIAVATSGNYRKFKMLNGQKYGHTINPKTGYPMIDPLLSVSVFSKKCIDADALSTSLLAMGLQEAILFVKDHKDIQYYFIYSNSEGHLVYCISDSLKDIIVQK